MTDSTNTAATASADQVFPRDLERESDPRLSLDGIGSPISSSDSSIMGEDIDGVDGAEWGPSHPCYPHRNPYVPRDSPEYTTTRIIRVRRDFLLTGDLAPTFTNLYPELLDPAGLPEQEFRAVIENINSHLIETYNPYNVRNIVDGVIGVLTGWIWEDVGFTNVKLRLRSLERWIEEWNKNMERTMETEGRGVAPKIIPLRLSGYMSLDIQIPDPEISEEQQSPTTPGSGVPRDEPETPKLGVEVV